MITELHNYSTIVAVVLHGLIDGTFCSYHSGRRVLVHQRLHTEELCDVLGNSSEDAVSARCRHSMALARIPSTNSCDHNWQNLAMASASSVKECSFLHASCGKMNFHMLHICH